MSSDRRASLLLAIGALVGAGLAASSLVGAEPASDALPDDAIAAVDGRPIRRADYERALAALAADRRAALGQDDRRRVLSRLIDEELLVGRALELGLASRDRRVRRDLAAAMLDVVRAADAPADEATLRAFHAEHAERFRRPPRFEIAHAWFSARRGDAEARRRAEAATAGGRLDAGDDYPIPIPDGPLSLSTIARLLGPTAARGVAELAPATVGGPWRGTDGYHVVRVVTRDEGDLPPFEEIVEVVREQHAREEADRRLRELLDELREDVEIVVAEERL